jgi:hypothetical protein
MLYSEVHHVVWLVGVTSLEESNAFSRFQVSQPASQDIGLDRPLGFQEVEAPRFQDDHHKKGGRVVSPTHRPPLPHRKCSWYSLLLEAEPTPGPACWNVGTDRNFLLSMTVVQARMYVRG